MVLFTLASLGCAAAGSLAELLAMRVMQGVGGAMMVPVGRLVVLAGAPKGELMRFISYLTWPALVAPVTAPLAGGLIATYASWPLHFSRQRPARSARRAGRTAPDRLAARAGAGAPGLAGRLPHLMPISQFRQSLRLSLSEDGVFR